MRYIIILFLFTLNLYSQTYLEKKSFQKIMKLYKERKYHKCYENLILFLKNFPSSYYLPDVYFYIGELSPDYFNAIVTYQELLEKFPEYNRNDEVLFKLAKLYFLHSNYTESLKTFGILFKKYPSSKFIYPATYWYGLTYLLKGETEKARFHFERIIDKKRGDRYYYQALLGKAKSLYLEAKYEEASKVYLHGYNLKSNFKPAFILGLADCDLKLKRYKSAYRYYRLILEKYSGSPEYTMAIENIKKIPARYKRISISQKKNSKFYSVQVASVKNKRFANDWRIKFRTQGYETFMKTIKTPSGKFYRTYVGRFKSREEALKVRNELKQKFKIKGIVVYVEG